MEYVERKSNLVVPEGFVELDREEMTYVDGGFYISNSQIINILAVCGLNPIATTIIGIGIYKLAQTITLQGAKLGSWIGGFIGGLIGKAVGALIGLAAVGSVALKIADALIQGKGINVDWKKTWFGMPYWVDLSVC